MVAELKRREIELKFAWHDRQKIAVEELEKLRHEGIGIPHLLYGGALGGGKSFLGCRYAVQSCEQVPGNRWYLCRRESATFMRTTYVTMTDAIDILARPGWHHAISKKFFWHDNRSRIDYGGLGGDPLDIDKVKSMDLGGLFIDEASEVDEPAAKMAMARVGRIIKAQGYEAIILASNPEQCWLISAFLQDPLPGWSYVVSLPTDNPYLTDMYIDNIKEIYGATPDLYKAYVEGDWFAVGQANKIYEFEHVTNAIERDIGETSPVEFGVDIARYGDDSTILAARFGNKIRILDKWQKKGIVETAQAVAAYARQYAPSVVKVDDIGLGGGVCDILQSWGINTVGIIASGRPFDTNRFANFKAEYAFSFKEQMKVLDLPPDMELRAQLLSLRYRIMPGGKIMLETKDEIKKRMGSSPDELDAVLMACIDVNPFYEPPLVVRNDGKVDISPC